MQSVPPDDADYNKSEFAHFLVLSVSKNFEAHEENSKNSKRAKFWQQKKQISYKVTDDFLFTF